MSLFYSYYDTLYPQAKPSPPSYTDLYSVTLGVPRAPRHVYHLYHYSVRHPHTYSAHPFNPVPKKVWNNKAHLPFLFVD